MVDVAGDVPSLLSIHTFIVIHFFLHVIPHVSLIFSELNSPTLTHHLYFRA